MTNIAAYLRVSTANQAGEDKFGIEAQRNSIEEWAKQNDVTIVAWYEDDGISGATLNRDGLQTLLADAEQHTFTGVLVAKMDRVARDLMAQLWIEKELLKHGVELISVSEPFRGQDPANVLFRQVIGAFAQFEKSRIAERMGGGRIAKAKTGGYAGGAAPMGYRAQRGQKGLTVDPEKAETVQTIFQLHAEHPDWSLRQLAQVLNAAGYTTAQNKPFHAAQVQRVLKRENFYQGAYTYAEVQAPGQHSPILAPNAS